METSSFVAEASEVLGELRVVMECKLDARGPGAGMIHHWFDNEGMVMVTSNSLEASSAITREHKACRHIIFAELESRVQQ